MDQAKILLALRNLHDAAVDGCFADTASPQDDRRGDNAIAAAAAVLEESDHTPD